LGLRPPVESLLAEFSTLTDLRPGWNGPGSLEVGEGVWNSAREIVSRVLSRLPQLSALPGVRFKLVPHNAGGVDVIWRETRRAWQLKIEIPSESAGETGGPWYFTMEKDSLSEGDLGEPTQFEDAINFLRVRTASG
jgi:hypothetical protein